MDEIIQAIEATVRRIVREELAAQPAAAPTPASTFGVSAAPTPEFYNAVKNCVLDQPWFDEAVTAEVASCGIAALAPAPAPAPQGLVFADRAEFERNVVSTVIDDGRIADYINDAIYDKVCDMRFSVSVS